MELVFRNYRPEDLPTIKAITVDAFEEVSIDRKIESAFGAINGRDWRWRKSRHIDLDVERDADGVFVAEVDGQVVGYVTTWLDREADVGYIPNLSVSGENRGRGIGRKLIQHALDYFRSEGIGHARIETLDQNPIGEHLYPSFGFREVARQIHLFMPLDNNE